MATLYGEATVYSYEAQGGIAVMSVGDSREGTTVSGGSGGDESGAVGIPSRILWSITQYDDDRYDGGITGVSLFLDEVYISYGSSDLIPTTGPFHGIGDDAQAVYAELFAYASQNHHLNKYFNEWNNTGAVNVNNFINYLYYMNAAPHCVDLGTPGN